MIEDFVIQTAQDRMMDELAPYIIVGFLAGILFVFYHLFERVDHTIERRKERKRSGGRRMINDRRY